MLDDRIGASLGLWLERFEEMDDLEEVLDDLDGVSEEERSKIAAVIGRAYTQAHDLLSGCARVVGDANLGPAGRLSPTPNRKGIRSDWQARCAEVFGPRKKSSFGMLYVWLDDRSLVVCFIPEVNGARARAASTLFRWSEHRDDFEFFGAEVTEGNPGIGKRLPIATGTPFQTIRSQVVAWVEGPFAGACEDLRGFVESGFADDRID